MVRVKARLQVHVRAVPWSDTWQNYLGGGEGAQNIHAKIEQASKRIKDKNDKNNTGNEAETKIVMEWYPIQATLEE